MLSYLPQEMCIIHLGSVGCSWTMRLPVGGSEAMNKLAPAALVMVVLSSRFARCHRYGGDTIVNQQARSLIETDHRIHRVIRELI